MFLTYLFWSMCLYVYVQSVMDACIYLHICVQVHVSMWRLETETGANNFLYHSPFCFWENISCRSQGLPFQLIWLAWKLQRSTSQCIASLGWKKTKSLFFDNFIHVRKRAVVTLLPILFFSSHPFQSYFFLANLFTIVMPFVSFSIPQGLTRVIYMVMDFALSPRAW